MMNDEDALKRLVAHGATYRDGSDFWKALCLLCHKEGVTGTAHFIRVTRKFERSFKQETGATSMPGKYHSVKNTLANALGHGVAYVEADGAPRGWTIVRKECGSPA